MTSPNLELLVIAADRLRPLLPEIVFVGSTNTAPGEIRGTAVEGGARQELRAGDVAHVPAGLSHQMLVANGETVTCLVMKVQENL